jgi:hypothetical protein
MDAARRKYVTEKPERVRASKAAYRDANRDELREKGRQRFSENRERINAQSARYKRERPHLRAVWQAERRARKLKATPAWVDRAAIKAVYAEAARLTRETGEKYSVDHIIPLKGKTACGLHVHWNLQVMTFRENCSKGAR